MFSEEEIFFICPYCAQQISFLIEGLYGDQTYIEDCEVCCQPIQIMYRVEDGQVVDVETERAD
jgi:hypothetical protein